MNGAPAVGLGGTVPAVGAAALSLLSLAPHLLISDAAKLCWVAGRQFAPGSLAGVAPLGGPVYRGPVVPDAAGPGGSRRPSPGTGGCHL